MSLSSFAFLASLFSCTSFIPWVLFQPFAVQLMMNDPYMIDYFDQISFCDFFRKCWLWYPGDIATRYQFSLSEAGAESVGQFTCQWALFLSINFLMGQSAMQNNAKYTNLFFVSLRNSTVTSLLSLTLSQIKTNRLSHEFSIGWKQKLQYALASLVNTISSTTLLIYYTTYSFDLIVL